MKVSTKDFQKEILGLQSRDGPDNPAFFISGVRPATRYGTPDTEYLVKYSDEVFL